MHLRILRNLGHGFPPFREGECRDVEGPTADRLLRLGLAEPLPADPAPVPAPDPGPAGGTPAGKPARKKKQPPPTEG